MESMDSKTETKAKVWQKPELTRLGKMTDVGPGSATSTRQGANNRT